MLYVLFHLAVPEMHYTKILALKPLITLTVI